MGAIAFDSALPRVKDTRWKIRAKLILALGKTPTTDDTKRKQLDKIERAFSGN